MARQDIHLFFYRRRADQAALPHSDHLLARAGEKFLGCRDGWQISRPLHGKPSFSQRPQIHFSLSHSGEYWLCAMGRQPVGLDLQEHRYLDAEGLSRRFFHPAEAAYLQAQEQADFFAVWAAKESFVKYSGQGIDQQFGSFSVVGEQGLAGEVAGLGLLHLPFLPGYALCLCTQSPGAVLFRPL